LKNSCDETSFTRNILYKIYLKEKVIKQYT